MSLRPAHLPFSHSRLLADHTAIVSGDRIVEVGPSSRVQVPSGATEVTLAASSRVLMSLHQARDLA